MKLRVQPVLIAAALFCGLHVAHALPAISVSDLPEKTPDGRFTSRCIAWGNDSNREFCKVSFYRLIATPEKYHGRLIGVVGFMITLFGEPVLFVNHDSYWANLDYEGVTLIGADIPNKLKAKIKNGVRPILVVGVFDANYIGTQIPRLGALRDIQIVTLLEHLPTGVTAE
jgi:hypothetical protein